MDFGKNLRTIRLQKGLTQKELGSMVGVSEVTVGNWERGIKQPTLDTFVAVGKALRTSLDTLTDISYPSLSPSFTSKSDLTLFNKYTQLDYHGKQAVSAICDIEYARTNTLIARPQILSTHTRYIPLYTTPSAAGTAIPLEGEDYEMIAVDQDTPIDADFAVKIQGNSMLPYIEDGSTVFVDRGADLKNGDIGIFCVDGSMYCKQFHIDQNGNIRLLSCNHIYQNTNIYIDASSSSTFKVFGKVIIEKVSFPDYFAV